MSERVGTGDAEAVIAEYDAERPARRLGGPVAYLAGAVAFGVSVYVLYAVFRPVPALQYRMAFLASVLPLTFLSYRSGITLPWFRKREAERERPSVADWAPAVLSVVVCAYPIFGIDAFIRRAGYPPAAGGGVLAAAGIGAILSPPTLGVPAARQRGRGARAAGGRGDRPSAAGQPLLLSSTPSAREGQRCAPSSAPAPSWRRWR
ncbi:hypothetical protein [Actinomadura sp. SCN-SB]|uniref:hypothetical protein n=1 Tax=Actinomadura sp. SCN-SB TaxID=3373092 RepID=UPI0037521188